MFFFPRLTLIFSSVPFGGLLWWLGWIFAPRLLVAIFATTYYWHTNTILVILSWIWALGLESGEKHAVRRVGGIRIRKRNKGEVIDAEYKRD